MAIDTQPWVFVPYAGPKRATISGDPGSGRGGRIKARKSGANRGSRPPDRDDDLDASADTVNGPSESQQLSADVLVIDDEADVRWTVAEVLRSAGFSVAEAEDGEIAFGLLSSERYRMVILDIKMPKRDGVSLIEAVGKMVNELIFSGIGLLHAQVGVQPLLDGGRVKVTRHETICLGEELRFLITPITQHKTVIGSTTYLLPAIEREFDQLRLTACDA